MKWVSTKTRLPIEEYNKFVKKYPKEDLEVNVVISGAEISTSLYFDGHRFF